MRLTPAPTYFSYCLRQACSLQSECTTLLAKLYESDLCVFITSSRARVSGASNWSVENYRIALAKYVMLFKRMKYEIYTLKIDDQTMGPIKDRDILFCRSQHPQLHKKRQKYGPKQNRCHLWSTRQLILVDVTLSYSYYSKFYMSMDIFSFHLIQLHKLHIPFL